MPNESNRIPHNCLCCKKPLTYSRKEEVRDTTGERITTESWVCTNQECITYRMKDPKPPTPPLSK